MDLHEEIVECLRYHSQLPREHQAARMVRLLQEITTLSNELKQEFVSYPKVIQQLKADNTYDFSKSIQDNVLTPKFDADLRKRTKLLQELRTEFEAFPWLKDLLFSLLVLEDTTQEMELLIYQSMSFLVKVQPDVAEELILIARKPKLIKLIRGLVI